MEKFDGFLESFYWMLVDQSDEFDFFGGSMFSFEFLDIGENDDATQWTIPPYFRDINSKKSPSKKPNNNLNNRLVKCYLT
jgi:hypothetical protein